MREQAGISSGCIENPKGDGDTYVNDWLSLRSSREPVVKKLETCTLAFTRKELDSITGPSSSRVVEAFGMVDKYSSHTLRNVI